MQRIPSDAKLPDSVVADRFETEAPIERKAGIACAEIEARGATRPVEIYHLEEECPADALALEFP